MATQTRMKRLATDAMGRVVRPGMVVQYGDVEWDYRVVRILRGTLYLRQLYAGRLARIVAVPSKSCYVIPEEMVRRKAVALGFLG